MAGDHESVKREKKQVCWEQSQNRYKTKNNYKKDIYKKIKLYIYTHTHIQGGESR